MIDTAVVPVEYRGESMGTLIEMPDLRNKVRVFADRKEAGKMLAENLPHLKERNLLTLAVPSGGVPIGLALQSKIHGAFDVLIVRKIQIPWNTEAGFGAMNLDEDVIINQSLLYSLRLSEEEVKTQIAKTKTILDTRNTIFRKNKEFPGLHNRTVILADDGLASGYTMRAAIQFIQRRNPAAIGVAVPTGQADTVMELLRTVDWIACINIRESYPFAVADAYRSWYDLDDAEVLKLLNRDPGAT